MGKKITMAELADGLASRATIPVSFSEKFVKSFFEVIEEGLIKEKLVKIKGFGTFKLVDVDARESVDVNTGERILLSAHSKVSFTPDAALKDTINSPFADFETVLLNDGTPTEQMEADIMEPAAESIASEKEEAPALAEHIVSQSTADNNEQEKKIPLVQEKVVAEGKKVQVEQEDIAVEQEKEVAVQKEELVKDARSNVTEPIAPATEETKPSQQNISSQQNSNWRKVFSYLLLILLSAFLGYSVCYYLRPFELPNLKSEVSSNDASSANKGQPSSSDTKDHQSSKDAGAESVAGTSKSSGQTKQANNYPQLEGGEYEIVGVQGTEVMLPGKTLLNFSLKYYKSTDFVPYICVMNGIENPDVVPLNKELQIPELKHK